jgi:hypothetical protein
MREYEIYAYFQLYINVSQIRRPGFDSRHYQKKK